MDSMSTAGTERTNRIRVATGTGSQQITRRLFTIREIAEYTGLSAYTLYNMTSQRRIPFVKVGRLVKFDLKVIDAWIERHSVKPLS